jgi:hypothetical protein
MSSQHGTQGDKSQRGAGQQQRIQTATHAIDDLVCDISGTHVIDVIYRFIPDIRDFFHFVPYQLLSGLSASRGFRVIAV